VGRVTHSWAAFDVVVIAASNWIWTATAFRWILASTAFS
jgi:hypothetical protein